MRNDQQDGSIPEGLRQELRRLATAPLKVDDLTDARIRSTIHAHFEAMRRPWWQKPLPRVAVAAAVLILALVLVEPRFHGPQTEAALLESCGPADVDRNGRVDILDAFALARHIEARGAASSDPKSLAWDQNGDGFVNRRDVEVIAQAAVFLGEDG